MNQTEWSLDLKIKDGPSFKEKGKFDMEGYDRIDVVVPAQSSWVVNVQPGQLDDVQLFFVIRTDQAPAPAEDGGQPPNRRLYYTIGDSTTQIELTDLHVVLGSGAMRLLCGTPDELCFTNEGDQDATVIILICRQTTAPCDSAEQPAGTTGQGSQNPDPAQTPVQKYPDRGGSQPQQS
jgi:hypothetical protein